MSFDEQSLESRKSEHEFGGKSGDYLTWLLWISFWTAGSSAAIQVKRLFFSPAENELLPVLGVRLIERLEH